jgi:Tfp pilus assembly protein PilN
MINLLPQKEKDNLFLKRIKNLVIILGAVITVSLICFILILLSLKFYMLSDVGYQKALLLETQERYQSPAITTLKDAIQKYNKLLPLILSFYQNKANFSDTLGLISEIERPHGLYFTNISISENNKVSISGFSPTRDDLINFQKNLQKQNGIKNISFSPNSWINQTKANFNLTLEYGN